jgi:ketosteroid isomerase-like protein
MAGLTLLAVAACQRRDASVEAAPDPSKEADVIRDAETAWSKEMALKSPEKMAAHYAAGAPIYQTGAPLIHGPQGVKAVMARAFKDPAFKLEFTPEEVHVAKSGDMAYVTGSYSFTRTDPKTKAPKTVEGTYLTVYTRVLDAKTQGPWLVVAEFGGDLPPDDDDG